MSEEQKDERRARLGSQATLKNRLVTALFSQEPCALVQPWEPVRINGVPSMSCKLSLLAVGAAAKDYKIAMLYTFVRNGLEPPMSTSNEDGTVSVTMSKHNYEAAQNKFEPVIRQWRESVRPKGRNTPQDGTVTKAVAQLENAVLRWHGIEPPSPRRGDGWRRALIDTSAALDEQAPRSRQRKQGKARE